MTCARASPRPANGVSRASPDARRGRRPAPDVTKPPPGCWSLAFPLRATSRSGGGFVSHNVGSRYGSVNGARAAAVDGGGDDVGTVRSVVVDARRTPLWMGDGDDRGCGC